jgi:hypothetical protein
MRAVFGILFFSMLAMNISASELIIQKRGANYIPAFTVNGITLLTPPPEGLWSIALDWQDDWPANWAHASADSMEIVDEWTILHGKITLPEGEWILRDAFRKEGNRVRCIRRFEWNGEKTIEKVTLSSRWQTLNYTERVVMPGIIYYGNPSGYRNGGNMPTFGIEEAPEAFFEEHRFPMPFVAVEIEKDNRYYTAAVHTLPCPVPYSNIPDQWWSMGTKALENSTEIALLSGPVAWNNQRSVAKARQRFSDAMKYSDTWLNVKPGAVIEKTFFTEVAPFINKGSGFIQPVKTSMDIFSPFYAEDMPTFWQIIHDKYRFAQSRYVENDNTAGFSMYPLESGAKFVFGWCGQAASPGYALQKLSSLLVDPFLDRKVQRSLDQLSRSPFNDNGFQLIYDFEKDTWDGQDPLSQGQGMYNFAKAIQAARDNRRFDTSLWKSFFRKACDVHARRILNENWNPRSTNEGFLVAPLSIAWELYQKQEYFDAAKKAADHYMNRHLDMDEPYWGGTLDATGEDKEGAWAGFQAFLSMYEITGEEKYLKAAEHAAYILLSYTVVWDIPFPAGRMADHFFKTRGWTTVSPQNMHIDVFGVLFTPSLYKLGDILQRPSLKKIALLMFRSCGQMIDPYGSHGEQLQHTNFAQAGDMSNIYKFRGGYVEHWTVFWITAHFLNAAAQFMELDPDLIQPVEEAYGHHKSD